MQRAITPSYTTTYYIETYCMLRERLYQQPSDQQRLRNTLQYSDPSQGANILLKLLMNFIT